MPHDISFKTAKKFLDKVQWDKVVQKASNTPQGQRVFPSRTPKNDAGYNFRIDKGADVDGKSELILQANKNAEDKKVKEAAQKNSHAILGKALVDPENDKDGQGAKKQLEASFRQHK
ncbi:hypothetical protein B0A49_08684 [Cryomyces minteri]|uniref:Uncharacterized protein n=1 Tax=Cryomyces minteri TaxID=331657 RepID=A0A4U0X2W3_9PEZI|nr:hypothetical protein B0A49_08684 [Cryomyces minteri]